MSFLKKLDKFVSGRQLTVPNKLMLKTFVPVQLSTKLNPTLGHIHSLRSLLWHIQQLEEQSGFKKQSYMQKSINHEMQFLKENFDIHLHNAIRYIQGGGALTAQAIADMFSIKKDIRATDEWFSSYVNPTIQEKLQYMTISNIYSVLNGLKGSKSNEALIDKLLSELGKRKIEEYDFVQYDSNKATVYKYASNKEGEWNPLLDTCKNNQSFWNYQFTSTTKYMWDWLHSLFYNPDALNNNFRLAVPPTITKDDVRKLLEDYRDQDKAQRLLEKL